MVSVRRSLFSTVERKKYLQSIMDGIKKVRVLILILLSYWQLVIRLPYSYLISIVLCLYFLPDNIDSIFQVLDNGSRLSEPACYHQFCRLLAKLKCNYQLNELVDIDGYESIIDTIAKFTISSLEVCVDCRLFSILRNYFLQTI